MHIATLSPFLIPVADNALATWAALLNTSLNVYLSFSYTSQSLSACIRPNSKYPFKLSGKFTYSVYSIPFELTIFFVSNISPLAVFSLSIFLYKSFIVS